MKLHGHARKLMLFGIVPIVIAIALSTEKMHAESALFFTGEDGINISEHVDDAYSELHMDNSGSPIRENFSDLELVYTDVGAENESSEDKPPFNYYYSAEAKKTFGICNSNRSVVICDGRVDHAVERNDIVSGTCVAAPVMYFRSDFLQMVK